jgi:hypothetical protein
MHMSQAQDPSTLASLKPDQVFEEHYLGYRNSVRLHGSHFMTLRRPSRMPENSREYTPGDPVSRIDWQAYARTDQLIIREIRDEAAVTILIVVDISETMLWPRPGEPLRDSPPAKAEIALRVALNLAHAHLQLGDFVEIWALSGGKALLPDRVFVPRTLSDLTMAYGRLAAHGFSKEASEQEFSQQVFEDQKKRDVVFWVGDGLSSGAFGPILGQGKRSFFWHVLSSLEENVDWVDGDTSYFDVGTVRKEYQGSVLKYRDNYKKHLEGWKAKLAARQRRRLGEYMALSDQTTIRAYHDALMEFLRSKADLRQRP